MPAREASLDQSCRKSASDASPAFQRAITTKSQPDLSLLCSVLMTSRNRLLTVFRVTAPPTFRLVTRPKRKGTAELSGKAERTKKRPGNVLPSSLSLLNSLDAFIRRRQGRRMMVKYSGRDGWHTPADSTGIRLTSGCAAPCDG